MKTVRIKISGKVQGVFFRATAKEVAKRYNIFGWIKNTDDDKVEAVITGEGEDIERFINWCKKGPAKANVTNVATFHEGLQVFNKFEIVR
jgi:acylphosphatase